MAMATLTDNRDADIERLNNRAKVTGKQLDLLANADSLNIAAAKSVTGRPTLNFDAEKICVLIDAHSGQVYLTKAAVRELGEPPRVRFLLDGNGGPIILATDINDHRGLKLPLDGYPRGASYGVCPKRWVEDLELYNPEDRTRYMFDGSFCQSEDGEYKAIVFDPKHFFRKAEHPPYKKRKYTKRKSKAS